MDRAKSDRPRMRPRYEVTLDVPIEGVLASLREELGRSDAPVRGVVRATYAELRVPEAQAHFWSPRLSLELERGDAGSGCLRGRFAPDPSVWMLFMGLYGVFGMGGTLAVMFGVSQWMIRNAPWALLGAPVALALAALTYGAAFIGQGLGASQMYVLRAFVDHAIEAAREAPEPRGAVANDGVGGTVAGP